MKTRSTFRSSIKDVHILTAVYLFIYQHWYSGTPLGLEPAPDGKYILLAADKMYRGESFDEPFAEG